MGQFLVVLSAFGFSTLAIFGKLAYEAGFTRNQMLFWRFGLALPLLSLILLFTKSYPKNKKVFLKAVVLGTFGIGIEASFYFLTLEHLGAALTGIFLYLYPAFIALISCFIFRQKLSPMKWFCIVLSLIGTVLVVGLGFQESANAVNPLKDITGVFFGVMTGLTYAIYLLIGNRINGNEKPLTVSSGIVCGAFIAFSALTFLEVGQGTHFNLPVSREKWVLILGMTVLASVLPFTTLYAGMKRVGPVATSILSTLELVFTLILAFLFLGEKLTLIQGAGAALILLSVLLASLFR